MNDIQINDAIFKKKSPSEKDILFWKNRPDLIPVIQSELSKHYRLFKKKPEQFFSEKRYSAFCRTLNLADHYQCHTFFEEAIEVYIMLAETEDEILEGIISHALINTLSNSNEEFLLNTWNILVEDFHEAEFFIVSLLLKIKCKNNKFISGVKSIYDDDPEWILDDIIQGIDDKDFQDEVLSRMHYIAPMVKYLENDRNINEYYDEMIEVGTSWLDKNYPEKISDKDHKSTLEKNFFTEIMGMTSEKSTDLILKKIQSYCKDEVNTLKEDQPISQYLNRRDKLFEDHFFKTLPPRMDEWLNSPCITQAQKEDFLRVKYNIEEIKEDIKREAEAISLEIPKNIGRNDPCYCGSNTKYKKCCLNKVNCFTFSIKYLWSNDFQCKIKISGEETLCDLHDYLQDTLKWDYDHMYSFFLNNRFWDRSYEYSGNPLGEGSADTCLKKLPLKLNQKLAYVFDYGDEHRFEMKVESIELLNNFEDVTLGLISSTGEVPIQYADDEFHSEEEIEICRSISPDNETKSENLFLIDG